MCVATRDIMDCMFEAYLANEGVIEADDIPQTKDPIWILGKKYNGSEGSFKHTFAINLHII